MKPIEIPASTQQVITDSSFHRAGTFLFVHARSVRTPERHLMITRDEKELTVVTRESELDDLDVIAINHDRWTLFPIECASPFYCVGFIAKISEVLSGGGIDILVVSTFSRDWVFAKESEAERAAGLLRQAGLTETGGGPLPPAAQDR